MHLHFRNYLLPIKIFFLCVSIILVASALSFNTSAVRNDGASKIFIVDRQSDVQIQLQSIDAYIASVTGQAVGLSTYDGITTTVLLPATTDYNILRTYLHTISSLSSGEIVQQREEDGEQVLHHPKSTIQNLELGSLLSFILALFL